VEQVIYAADLAVELSSIIAVSLTNQTAMLESAWSLRQCGQEISASVLANLRKVALSTSTPVETSCPVLGHTKRHKATGALFLRVVSSVAPHSHALPLAVGELDASTPWFDVELRSWQSV
jgi:hypothetical protein